MIQVDTAIYFSGLALWLWLMGCGLSMFFDAACDKLARALWRKKDLVEFIWYYRLRKHRRRALLMARHRDE